MFAVIAMQKDSLNIGALKKLNRGIYQPVV
jgi:hypothetical protein